MNVKIASRYTDIDISELTNMVSLAIGKDVGEITIIKESRVGRYIEFEYENEVYMVCFSAFKETSRNSYIMQYLPPFINKGIERENTKLFVYYIRGSMHNSNTPYHINTNRLLKTLGITILNERNVMSKVAVPYSNYRDYYNTRFNLRERNVSNNSSYFFEEDDKISFYGKLFGANVQESIVMVVALRKLSGDKRIVYYPVLDNESRTLSMTNRSILTYYNIEIDSILYSFSNTSTQEVLEKEIRDQATFKKNLIDKFGVKKCYLCDCTIDSAIVAAHIHRVADIKREDISHEEKVKRVIDGDNGLWLCKLHDIFFETGLIYFDGDELQINSDLPEEDYAFIEQSLTNTSISSEDYTIKMMEYLSHHFARVIF